MQVIIVINIIKEIISNNNVNDENMNVQEPAIK